MKRIALLTVLTCALAPLAVGCFPTATVQPVGHYGSANHPVRAFYVSGIEAFNAHDLDAFMRQFGDDIAMYTPTGWLRGKPAVRERFAQTFTQFPDVRMEVEDLRVREVAPGVATVDFAWRVYPMGAGPAFHGVGSGVYVLRGDQWEEVLEHETVTRVDEPLGSGQQ
jgi:uncharacterized protein (TIGR02246 family)